jgi:hypothetical protein
MQKSLLISLPLMLAPLGALAQDSKPALPKGVRLVKPLSPKEASTPPKPKAKPKAKKVERKANTKGEAQAQGASAQGQAGKASEATPKQPNAKGKESQAKTEVNAQEAKGSPRGQVKPNTAPTKAAQAKPESAKAPKDAKGAQAPKGAKGAQAPKGAKGAQAPKGVKGAQAPKGVKGAQEPKGVKGAQATKDEKGDEKKAVNTELPTPQKLDARPKVAPRPPTVVEGELVHVGQIGILPWDDRFGMVIGVERLGEIYYGSVNVGVNHTFKFAKTPLQLTLGVPLRFEVLDARPDQRFNNLGQFRV